MEQPTVIEVAVEAAVAAGAELLAHRSGGVRGVTTKSSDTDLVSDADRAAEQLIVARITSAFPRDGILGEEGATKDGDSGRRWVIDPLDGTTNFVYGLDSFCVSIGVEDESGPLAGCVHDPVRGETFRAWRGGGAELNGTPIRPSATEQLEQALLGTGFSYRMDQREWQARVVSALVPRVRDIRRIGSAALDLCWVAAGRLDGHVERGLAPWDHAAGILIASEAGARVRQPAPSERWGLVSAAAPGIADALFELTDRLERAAGPRPE